MTSHGVRIDLSYFPAMQSPCVLPVIHLARSEDLGCIETTACDALQLGPSSSLVDASVGPCEFLVRKKEVTALRQCPETLLRA